MNSATIENVHAADLEASVSKCREEENPAANHTLTALANFHTIDSKSGMLCGVPLWRHQS